MKTPINIREESPAQLPEYARVSTAFEVREVFDVMADDGERIALSMRELDAPYVKSYDAVGEGPAEWPDHFDVSNWGFLAARIDGRRVGGAAVAFRTSGLEMLGGRDDVAVLWDLRVAPEDRGKGVGAALFGAAERWAAARGCRRLIVETQNINVPACRFYARQGCVLVSADEFSYPGLPDEIQLIWHKDLSPEAPAG